MHLIAVSAVVFRQDSEGARCMAAYRKRFGFDPCPSEAPVAPLM